MENNLNYELGTKVVMKKQHPCGANEWEITRLGADIKIKCLNCGRTILIPRIEFNKREMQSQKEQSITELNEAILSSPEEAAKLLTSFIRE